MRPPVLVINPNSREAVTDDIRAALTAVTDYPVDCVTMAQNPAFIVTEDEIASVGLTVAALAGERPDAAAVVIACYAQPGLDALRAGGKRPVVGIQDAAIATALAIGGPFGVIALSQGAIERHLRHVHRLGLARHLAAEVALPDICAATAEETFAALAVAGEDLAARGATSIILGCAGLGRWRQRLSGHLGLPVIDPVVAAMGTLLGGSLP